MTNREKLMELTAVDLYEMMVFLITSYSKQSTNSRVFMTDWLERPYNKDDWAWRAIDYERA